MAKFFEAFLQVRLFTALYLVYKRLGGFESRDIVGGDDNGGVLRNVPTGFFSPALNGEATKTPQVNVFTVYKRRFYNFHEGFNHGL